MKDKGIFKVTTRTIVAAGLGAALFALLFMFVKIPSPVPDTYIQTAYGLPYCTASLMALSLIHI